ncbi:hypothetical protein FACS189499_05280 [Clostridia bacterium]|nr:hypothetical protein FACS189499_05280 [Clostridia bacterium]
MHSRSRAFRNVVIKAVKRKLHEDYKNEQPRFRLKNIKNFYSGANMIVIVIRTCILYAVIIFAMRLMGKKQLGELQPSELVTTILVSNIATLSIEDPNLPMFAGVIPILLIVSLDVIMSVLTMKNEKLRKLVAGNPRVLISGGVINQREMMNLRYTADDLLEAMRDNGIFDIAEVDYAIVETNGKINFLQKGTLPSVPELAIKNGEVTDSGLKVSGIEKILRKEKISAEDVYMLTTDTDGNYYLVKKQTAGGRPKISSKSAADENNPSV